VGRGEGVFSFVHIDDAASAAVCALTQGRGVYNIADDHPAATTAWIPVFCEAVGAPPPLRVPGWVVGLLAGGFPRATIEQGRGVSSARAHADLGWRPSHPSWREGFAAEGR
jgi:nucleoside-diphosphate-sugar epimerase